MCCDAPEPPKPDPAIGQAAQNNVQLGKDSLDFAKQQWAAGNIRQDQYDAMVKQVVDSQLASQGKANQWAQDDRDQGQAGKNYFDALANNAVANGNKYEGWLGSVSNDFANKANDNFAFAKDQQGRYTTTFAPIEDRIASDAMSWDSAERQTSEAAKAKADVVDNASAQQAASQRNLASMGVNPNSGRFAGITRASDTTTALNAAGAQNAARDTVRQQGIALRGQAAAVGQNVLGSANTAESLGLQARAAQQNGIQAANGASSSALTQAGQLKASGLGAAGVGYQGLGAGLTAGNSAVGNQGAANSNFYANNGIMNQGYGTAIGANNSAAGILNQQYGNQINAWGQQQQAGNSSAAGIGSLVTGLGGLGLKAYSSGALSGLAGLFSSKDYKTDKRNITGALEAVNGMPVQAWKYKEGIADGDEHIGPYAEDFKKATGRGDGKMIPVVDAIGVTMKAVQELSQKVDAMNSKGAR